MVVVKKVIGISQIIVYNHYIYLYYIGHNKDVIAVIIVSCLHSTSLLARTFAYFLTADVC